MSRKKQIKMPSFVGPLIAVIVVSIVLGISSEAFFKFGNIMNILRQCAINAMVSLGMLMILLTGGIDISVGSTVALSSCSMGVLMKVGGVTNPIILIIFGLVIGCVCGLINGLLFTKLHLPHPFVSTMGTKMAFRGAALLITAAAPIAGFSSGVTFVGSANIGSFPVCFVVVLVLFAIVGIFLARTALGRNIYSVGGNKEAARLAGINVDKTLLFVYVMSGLMCAIAGIIMVGRVGSATPLAGETYDTDAIAACVIGGASMNGGKGTVGGTIIGALLISIIRNGLNLLGAQTDVQYIVIGMVIIVAVFIDVIRANQDAKSRLKAVAKAQGNV